MHDILTRASLYRYFATLYRYPDEEAWAFVRDGAEHARAALAELGMSTDAFDELSSALGRIAREDVEPLYVRTFLNGFPSVLAPPYESLYAAEDDRLAVLTAVRDFYDRCGVAVRDDVRELPDHIATELEFMQYLCIEARNDPAVTAIVTSVAREFLNEHLVPFAGALAEAVEEGLYHHASKALLSFVTEDLEMVGDTSVL